MLRDIRLRFWPTYYDCLRWSQGGEIAILANEFVYILVPSKEDLKNIKGTPQFQATKAELRPCPRDDLVDEPACTKVSSIYSIGEEQGPGYVKAVEWSPLGVAHRRGCMLAVLTTTHHLKIFQPDGDPAKQWKIAHDISEHLDNYYGVAKSVQEIRIKTLQCRSRVMAWSSLCEFPGMKWGQSLLAVANDNLEVVLILTSSRSCKIACVFNPTKTAGPGFHSRLSWSPWRTVSRNIAECFLTVVHRGAVTLHRVSINREIDDANGISVSVDEKTFYHIGNSATEVHPVLGMTWYDKCIEGHWLFVYAIQLSVRVVAIKCDSTQIVAGKTMHVWEFPNSYVDPASGLLICLSLSHANSFEIHLSTVLGNTQIVNFNLPKTIPSASRRRHLKDSSGMITEPARKQRDQQWDYIIQEKKQDFIAEWDVNSATCKVWGIARSPFSGIIAAVISLEPDDSLQYVTHSRETSRLIFGTRIEGKDLVKLVYGQEKLPQVTDHSSENFIMECSNLFDAERTQTDGHEGTESLDSKATGFEALRDIINTYILLKDPSTDLPDPRISSNTTRLALIDTLSRNIFDPSSLTALRLAVCLRLFPQGRRDDGTLIVPLHKDEPIMVANLVMNILSVGKALKPRDLLSRRIIYSAAMIGVIGLWKFGAILLEPCREALKWLQSPESQLDFQWELQFIATAIDFGRGNRKTQEAMKEKRIALIKLEDKMTRCVLCEGHFKWEDLTIAECSGGHRYPRCAITYLPIQSGQDWKTCLICERSIFDIREQEDEMKSEDTLLAVLLDAWDICTHCGGRYR